MTENNYKKQKDMKYLEKLRQAEQKLPSFCGTFFLALQETTSIRTRLGYAQDLDLFFYYASENIDGLKCHDAKSITLADMELVQTQDIRKYLSWLELYMRDKKTHTNAKSGKARKLASLRSFYKQLLRDGMIHVNPAAIVESIKTDEKSITRLEPNEVADLLDLAENGSVFTGNQKAFHTHTAVRDLAILSLFLGTGMRISELAGINLSDINFKNNTVAITRKGGKQDVLYFGKETREALLNYALCRNAVLPVEGSEDAFFLSLRKSRVSVRMIQELVKKYSRIVVPEKKISPHKLRSTFGTNLYRETGDIYLVADVLGHKDVNTTRKHYAANSEDRRRLAAEITHLRE